jgi:hypothetical protein
MSIDATNIASIDMPSSVQRSVLGVRGSEALHTDVAAKQLFLPFVGEAHAGLIIAPAFPDPTIPAAYASARVDNLWLNICFDALVDHATTDAPLTPEQHALLLALGLAQFQTTWTWPPGQHWQSWFASNTPPDYWLAAYIWHLCWAIGDPDNTAAHQARATACLDRGDDPEIVADLRKYPIIPTPPEVSNLFDHL